MNKAIFAALTAALLSVSMASAQTAEAPLRPTTQVFQAEMGGSHLADTYLTPLIYDGYSLALQYERWQAMKFAPQKWIMHLSTRLEMDNADSPARNNSMWYAGLDLRWGMLRKWQLPRGFALALGGSTGIMAGVMYNGRNGNNPASAKASWTVDLTGMLIWNGRIGRLPITLSYQPTLPVTGVFFSPQYGELYYEIYLGDRKHLAHWANWSNYVALDNALMADLHFGSTSLRIGYRGSLYSTHVNHITSRITSNAFVIGVSGEWLSLFTARSIKPDARIIKALE